MTGAGYVDQERGRVAVPVWIGGHEQGYPVAGVRMALLSSGQPDPAVRAMAQDEVMVMSWQLVSLMLDASQRSRRRGLSVTRLMSVRAGIRFRRHMGSVDVGPVGQDRGALVAPAETGFDSQWLAGQGEAGRPVKRRHGLALAGQDLGNGGQRQHVQVAWGIIGWLVDLCQFIGNACQGTVGRPIRASPGGAVGQHLPQRHEELCLGRPDLGILRVSDGGPRLLTLAPTVWDG